MGLILIGAALIVGGVLAALTGVGLVVGVPAIVLGVVLVAAGSVFKTVRLVLWPARLLLRVLLAPVRLVLRLLRRAVPGA